MPDTVKITFESLGVRQVKVDHDSILKMSKSLQTSLLQLRQNTNLRIGEIDKKLAGDLKIINARKFKDDAAQEQARVNATQKASDQIIRIREREELRIQQMAQRAATTNEVGFGSGGRGGGKGNMLRGAGLLMQASGNYKMGYALRAMQSIDIGAAVGGIGEAVGAGVGLAGMAVGAGLASAALGVLAVGIEATVLTVDLFKNGLETTISSFVSAIGEIGKVKSLQQMIVEAADTESTAAFIAANTTDKVPQKQIEDVINKGSMNSDQSPSEIGALLKKFIGRTGTFADAAEMLPFLTDMMAVTQMNAEDMGTISGNLRQQFPNLSTGKTKEAMIRLWGLGREGAVELKDATSISEVLGYARRVDPDPIKGMVKEMGMVQLAEKFTGEQTADEAVTGVKRAQQEILENKGGKLSSILNDPDGRSYLKKSPTGETVVRDINLTLAKLVLFERANPGKGLKDVRAQKLLMGIDLAAEKGGIIWGDSRPAPKNDPHNILHDQQALVDMQEKLQDGTLVLDDFTGVVKNAKDTLKYQFGNMFQQIAGTLEPMLKDDLKALEPSVRDLAKYITDNSHNINEAFKKLGTIIEGAGLVLAEFGFVAAKLAGLVLPLITSPLAALQVAQREAKLKDLDEAQGEQASRATVRARHKASGSTDANPRDLAGFPDLEYLQLPQRVAKESDIALQTRIDEDKAKAALLLKTMEVINNLPRNIENMGTSMAAQVEKMTIKVMDVTPTTPKPTPASSDGHPEVK